MKNPVQILGSTHEQYIFIQVKKNRKKNMNVPSYPQSSTGVSRGNTDSTPTISMYNSQINSSSGHLGMGGKHEGHGHGHKYGQSVFGMEQGKGWKGTGQNMSAVVSPKRPTVMGSPRQMPAFLEGKNTMKASLIMEENGNETSSPPKQKMVKRMPRMSEHVMSDFSSPNNISGSKYPPFLQKAQRMSELPFNKTDEDILEGSFEKQPSLGASSSSNNFRGGNRGHMMRKSSFDPTAMWLQQSLNRRKEKIMGIDDFVQIKSLGGGKYGKVYLAREKKTNFLCALKIIEKNLLKEEQITEQFIRELKIQMYLNHPNIIRMYGYFHDHTNIYIILEVGTSGQLFKQLKKAQSMPEPRVATLMRQTCQAINELHSNQIIHRDIKPENIVMSDNVVKLCDFGWSVHMDKNLRTTFCGTPLYVCPEILRGKDYDEKIDIWSLGVMMYEMLVGENPFKITKEEELVKIVKDAVVIPSYVSLSSEAKNFLDCCLQKNPDQRSNIRELLNHQFFKKYPQKNDKKVGL